MRMLLGDRLVGKNHRSSPTATHKEDNQKISHAPTSLHNGSPYMCYFLSLHWFYLEEERVMQQSRDKYFPQFDNQGINPVGDNAQVTEYLHKQSHYLHPTR